MLSPLALSRLPLGFAALSFALGGCTIQTYSGDPNAPSRRPTPPSASRSTNSTNSTNSTSSPTPPTPPAPGAARPASSSQPRSTDATQPEKGSSRLRRPGAFANRRPGTGRATADPGAQAADPGASTAPKLSSPNPFGNGTGGRFRGLAYVIPEGTTKMPDFSSLVPFATLYTNSFNVAPQQFSAGFPGALAQNEWFGIRYEGNFVVAAGGNYKFKLTSDDGAILYVDGQKVVDNDGVHTAKTAEGTIPLTAGTHALRLDYFQASQGQVALQLTMSANGQTQSLAP